MSHRLTALCFLVLAASALAVGLALAAPAADGIYARPNETSLSGR